jgi:hypothetical protein
MPKEVYHETKVKTGIKESIDPIWYWRLECLLSLWNMHSNLSSFGEWISFSKEKDPTYADGIGKPA